MEEILTNPQKRNNKFLDNFNSLTDQELRFNLQLVEEEKKYLFKNPLTGIVDTKENV